MKQSLFFCTTSQTLVLFCITVLCRIVDNEHRVILFRIRSFYKSYLSVNILYISLVPEFQKVPPVYLKLNSHANSALHLFSP